MTKVERIQWFMETMRDFVNTEDAGDYLLSKGFFTSPASTKYHGNYEGGLLTIPGLLQKPLLNSPVITTSNGSMSVVLGLLVCSMTSASVTAIKR